MRIAVLGTPGGWHVGQLLRAGREAGHAIEVVEFHQLTAHLGPRSATLHLGQFDLMTVDRVIVRGIPSGSLEQIVFRMDALHRLRSAGVLVLNPPAAIEACVDKYLATARLQAAGLPVPRTIVCEGLEQAMEAFAELGGSVVVKPVFGSEGRGILHVEDESLAYRVLRTLFKMQAVLYLQERIDHPGHDVRALVLGDQVIATMRRSSETDFRTNVARGARVERYQLSDEWAELAIRSARAIGAPLAGVDLLPDRHGRPYVLEVNSNPGFEAISQTTDLDIARAIIDFAAIGW